jgi:hypothetical protein
MTDPKPEQRGRGWAFYVLVILIALPILYVLSAGPAMWLGRNGYLGGPSSPAREAFYWPLIRLSERSPALEKWISWWTGLGS